MLVLHVGSTNSQILYIYVLIVLVVDILAMWLLSLLQVVQVAAEVMMTSMVKQLLARYQDGIARAAGLCNEVRLGQGM